MTILTRSVLLSFCGTELVQSLVGNEDVFSQDLHSQEVKTDTTIPRGTRASRRRRASAASNISLNASVSEDGELNLSWPSGKGLSPEDTGAAFAMLTFAGIAGAQASKVDSSADLVTSDGTVLAHGVKAGEKSESARTLRTRSPRPSPRTGEIRTRSLGVEFIPKYFPFSCCQGNVPSEMFPLQILQLHPSVSHIHPGQAAGV